MSIPWHNNDLAALARISLSLPSSHTKLSLLFAIMDPIVFVYSFTIEGYNVIVTIEFFFLMLLYWRTFSCWIYG